MIFILGRFDELSLPSLFYDNLYNIWQLDKTRIHFIFAVNTDIFGKEIFEHYGQLRRILGQNLIYFPLYSLEDLRFAIQGFSQKYGYKLNKKAMEFAIRLCGGHPTLLRTCMRILSKNSEIKDEKDALELLANQQETKIILDDIWENLEEEEKNYALAITQGIPPSIRDIPERLAKLRLVKIENNKPFLFSPLFETFLKEKSVRPKTLTLDKQTEELLINGQPVEEKITLQEYHLLSSFLEKPNTVLSRDTIAEVLWGKESYDKYSDWSIDQIISQLRKKLERLGISSKDLQTIRGRGYRWIS